MKSLLALAIALLPGIAAAQSNTPINVTQSGTLQSLGTVPEFLLRPDGGCVLPGPPNNVSWAYCGLGPNPSLFIGLGQFARDEDLAVVSAQLTTSFQEGLDRAADRADDGAAMAGALDFVPPADGAANRIGAQAFTMGDRSAVGVSYTRAAGRLDLGIGVATSGTRTAGKVGVGISW